MVKIARAGTAPDVVASLPFSNYNQGYRSPGAFHVFRYEDSVDPRQVRARPHRHDFFQMLWLEEGRGTLLCDLEEYAFAGRSLAFFAPGRLHAWKHEIEPRGVMLGFPHSFFHSDSDYPGLLGRLSFLHEPVMPILHFDEREATEMGQHFSQLVDEAARPLAGREDIVRALVTIILCKIRRCRETSGNGAAAGRPAAQPVSLPQRFRLALDRNFPRLLKVSDYAKLLGVSRSYLNEELRAHTGITASDHIHGRTLLEAKRLLVYSPRTIAEIAYELQFRDPSYFSRFFRLRAKVSPGAYRQEQQQRLGQV